MHPLRAGARAPDAGVLPTIDLDVGKPKALVEVRLVLCLELVPGLADMDPLRAGARAPHTRVGTILDLKVGEPEALVEVRLVLRLELIPAQTDVDPLRTSARTPYTRDEVHHVPSPPFTLPVQLPKRARRRRNADGLRDQVAFKYAPIPGRASQLSDLA